MVGNEVSAVCALLVLLQCESKKRHQTLVHIFTKYWSIFKILSLLHTAGNLQQSDH